MHRHDEHLALVVIPVFNAAGTIQASVESVLRQTHGSIRVVAVDDASTDESFSVLSRLTKLDGRLTALRLKQNVGTYRAANYGLFHCDSLPFCYFCIHGADDVMHPTKIESQVRELTSAGGVMCSAGYERVDTSGRVLLRKACGHSMVIYQSRALAELGYYDDTRFAGDSEYYERCLLKYGASAERRVSLPLSRCLLADTNLTVATPVGSPQRSAYVESYRRRHARGNLFVSPGWTEAEYVRARGAAVVGGVATIRRRLDSLRVTVATVLPQLDRLIVYQNDYDEAPDFLKHPKIEVVSGLRTGIDMGDAGKFWAVDRCGPCVYFSLDDDLLYPPDYVSQTLRCLRQHGGRTIVTSHGRNMRPDAVSYYRDASDYYPALHRVAGEHFVQFGGTGVMAFDPAVVGVSFRDFRAPNMADIWMGLHARSRGIPIAVVPHESGWIRATGLVPQMDTIWARSQRDHSVQDSLIAGFDKSVVLRP